MIETIVLIVSILLILLVAFIVTRAVIQKHQIIGSPPIHAALFLLAKILVLINLTFLLLKGINVKVYRIFKPDEYIDIIALLFLIIGAIILFISTFKLNKDLIFGLSSSGDHKLQTTGIYSISRHPFYLGFIFILFSSCLFSPHYINIAAFIGAWIIHHFIMIREEQFLISRYGEEYVDYTKRVKRYITF